MARPLSGKRSRAVYRNGLIMSYYWQISLSRSLTLQHQHYFQYEKLTSNEINDL